MQLLRRKHLTGAGKGDHSREGVVYRGVTIIGWNHHQDQQQDTGHQGHLYFGETSRSMLVRGQQHLTALDKPEENRENAFLKHRLDYHQGEEQEVQFKLSLVKPFNKPLERQVWERVEIHQAQVDILMNSKLDHYQPIVGRMVITNQVRNGTYNGIIYTCST